MGFARGQLSPETKRLLRQLDPVGSAETCFIAPSRQQLCSVAPVPTTCAPLPGTALQVGGGGGRTVALTHIPHQLPADPDSDDPGAAEALVEHTGGHVWPLDEAEAAEQ